MKKNKLNKNKHDTHKTKNNQQKTIIIISIISKLKTKQI